MQCSRCRQPVRPGQKFCGECGAALPLPPLRQGDAAAAWPPPRPAERILGTREATEGERKQITVLFADLKGSMELLAGRDPEEARYVLDAVLERLIDATGRFDGIVNQVMGDGIMALFGAPLALEDHAVRACYAALTMQSAVAALAKRMAAERGIALQLRIGINSGEVVVRSIRNDLRMDYSAIGQTTHLAARMEQMAEPGSTFLTEATHALVEGFVVTRPLGPRAVRGRHEPVPVFELTGAGAARSRLEVAAARGLTDFVGREPEVAFLHAAMARARAGCGQFVTVVGEPGAGKSRLLHEAVHSAAAGGWHLVESSAAAYGRDAPYRTLTELLRRLCGIEEGDPVTAVRERIAGRLRAIDAALADAATAPLLALFDAVPADDARWNSLDASQRSAAVADAGLDVLLGESRRRPLLLLLDDLQWVDGESRALLDRLAGRLDGACLLVLASLRSGHPAPEAGEHCTGLRVEPLDSDGAQALLAPLLGGDPGLDPLKRLLVEHTGGNPLFLEECVRMLADAVPPVLRGDRGSYGLAAPIATIRVPATVQSIIAARIDRLDAEDRRLLGTASVIGQDFAPSLLRAVAGLDEGVLQRGMARLAEAGFVHEASLFPERLYAFKHVQTQQVAYGLVLIEQRRRLHREIARWCEARQATGGSVDNVFLAHHLEAGGEAAHAAQYLALEADRLFGLGMARQAAALGLRAVRLLGVELPERPQEIGPAIGREMQAVGALVAGREPADLLALPALACEPVRQALVLLLRAAPLVYQSRQIELYALIALTCLRMTIEHGHGSHSAEVYSLYSVVHGGLGGSRAEAAAWSELALELDRRHGRPAHARVAFVHGWFHNHWTRPLSTSVTLAREAAEAACRGGDVLFECFNGAAVVIYQAALGMPLPQVIVSAREQLARNGRRVMNSAFHLIHELQVAKALAGLTADPLSLSDAEFDEERDLASICRTELGNQIGYYLVSQVKLRAHFGDWRGALDWAGRAAALRQDIRGQVAEIDLVQFETLAALGAALAGEAAPAAAIDRALPGVRSMRDWAGCPGSHLGHKALLLEGVLAGVQGDARAASDCFGRGLAALQAAACCTHDAGLIHEWSARLHRQAGDGAAALAAAAAAHAAYGAWGAAAKQALVRREFGLAA